jgi:supervillin
LDKKGRRYCQTRLVEPIVESLNNNDCFILITVDHLFLWIGENANIIEKKKANDIYDWIRFKKDLGFGKSNQKQTNCSIIESQNVNSSNYEQFQIALSSNKSINEVISSKIHSNDEDEHFEMAINDTNMVYSVDLIDQSGEQNNDDNDNENELLKK